MFEKIKQKLVPSSQTPAVPPYLDPSFVGHLIIGSGEVGRSLFHVLCEQGKIVYIRDVDPVNFPFRKIAFLHICFPCTQESGSDGFVETVKRYVEEYKPGLVFIHSTVPIGATRKIGENCVHSPVRGRHPYLEQGIKTFVKYFGYQHESQIPQIHLAFNGFKLFPVKNPETTELGKIMDTTRYGWEILFMKECKKECEKYNIPFEIVYSEMNKTYNEGYKELGHPEFRRSILKYVEGKIGGHCVVQNCHLLDSFVTDIIIDKNEEYGSNKNKML